MHTINSITSYHNSRMISCIRTLRQCNRNRISQPQRSITLGRASTVGTRYFLTQSKLQMHHRLKVSNLYINPVIVSSPMGGARVDKSVEALYHGAVLQNRSNCIYVYANKEDGVWSSQYVKDIVEAGVDREGLVTVADIGKVRTKDDILRTLEEAWKLTDQEYIDIAIMEFDDHWKNGFHGDYQGSMQLMEELCEKQILHAYGFSLFIEPFTQHTPPVGGHWKNVMTPIQLESEIRNNLPHCELVVYPLSPSIALSTATSMLPHSAEHTAEDLPPAAEEPRNFTRVAAEPLSCYRGHGPSEPTFVDNVESSGVSPEAFASALRAEDERNKERGILGEESGAILEGDPVVPMFHEVLPADMSATFCEIFDKACPALRSTPKLEHKVLRIVMSYGHEVVLIEPEMASLLGKLPLKSADIVSVDDVASIFGGFMISEEVDQALRETDIEQVEKMLPSESGQDEKLLPSQIGRDNDPKV